jgi:predicted phosphodiesterase
LSKDGHQFIPWGNLRSVELAARQMNVDVLISGNTTTHNFSVTENRTVVKSDSAKIRQYEDQTVVRKSDSANMGQQ